MNGAKTNPQKEYGYRNGQLLMTATAGAGWGSPPEFNDNPVVGGITVQSRHITELRTAINSLRTHLGLLPFSWQQSAEPGDWIKADPILEMRTALDEALGAPPPPGYSAGLSQNLPVMAIHIQELRNRVLAAWVSGSSLEINWLVADQLGTPRMVIGKTGALGTVNRHDYLPFGEELVSGVGGRTPGQGYGGDTIRQKFTSKERDNETNLDYFLARYYSSTQGRFTSPDLPFADQHETDPQSWNLYTYVSNSPLVLTDPFGLWKQVDCAGALGQCWQSEPGDDWSSLGIDAGLGSGAGKALAKFFEGQTYSDGMIVDGGGFTEWFKALPFPDSFVLREYEYGPPMGGGIRTVGKTARGAAALLPRLGRWLFGNKGGAARNIGGINAEQAARLRELLEKIPGAVKVRAFGSRTTGAFTQNSDLDIAILGNVDKANPTTLRAVQEAQRYAESIGIGTGKGYRPLDINVYKSVQEMQQAFRSSPLFDAARGLPKLVGIE